MKTALKNQLKKATQEEIRELRMEVLRRTSEAELQELKMNLSVADQIKWLAKTGIPLEKISEFSGIKNIEDAVKGAANIDLKQYSAIEVLVMNASDRLLLNKAKQAIERQEQQAEQEDQPKEEEDEI